MRKRLHPLHNLINKNFKRFDQLLFVLKTRLARYQRYPHQDYIEKHFKNLEGLINEHKKLSIKPLN